MLDPSALEPRYVATAIYVKREVKPEYLLTHMVSPTARFGSPALQLATQLDGQVLSR